METKKAMQERLAKAREARAASRAKELEEVKHEMENYMNEKTTQKGLKLTQKNHVKKLFEGYASFIKAKQDLELFKKITEDFIKASKGLSPNKVRNLFNSISKPEMKSPDREMTLRTEESKFGELKLSRIDGFKPRLAQKLNMSTPKESGNKKLAKEKINKKTK